MANEGVNSSAPTTAEIVGGVYNATPPTLQDGQAAAIQLDVNGKLITSGSGGGGGNVNIADVAGSPPALSNPLPVELSDGTNALGVVGNPLYTNSDIAGHAGAVLDGTAGSPSVGVLTVQGVSGGTVVPVTDLSIGLTGSTAPTSAVEIGSIDVNGNLQGASSSNPIPTINASIGVTGSTAPTSSTEIGFVNTAGMLQSVSTYNPLPISGSEYAGSPLMELMNRVLLELRGIRLAVTQTACEGGRAKESDFNPDNFISTGDGTIN